MDNTERFEIMILSKLRVEGLTIRSDWEDIEECFEHVASPEKCLGRAIQLRWISIYGDEGLFCQGCGADVKETMWCECGELPSLKVLRRLGLFKIR